MKLSAFHTAKPELRLYAHRGSNRVHPENTMPAFEQALADGATHLEMDVHRTRDGKILVHHDASALRMAGVDRLVRECSYAETQEWNVGARFRFGSLERKYRAPLFGDVLDRFPKTTINVDIKQHEPEVVDAVLKLIHSCGAERRVVINSFAAEVTARVRASGYPGETGVSVRDLMRLRFWPTWLWRLLRAVPVGASKGEDGRRGLEAIDGSALQLPVHGEEGRGLRRWIGARIRFDGPALLAKARAAGLRVDYWVVNDPPRPGGCWSWARTA